MVWRHRALICCIPYHKESGIPLICRSGMQTNGVGVENISFIPECAALRACT